MLAAAVQKDLARGGSRIHSENDELPCRLLYNYEDLLANG